MAGIKVAIDIMMEQGSVSKSFRVDDDDRDHVAKILGLVRS